VEEEQQVRQFSVPSRYEVTAGADLTELIHDSAAQAPARVVLAHKAPGAEGWRDVTAGELLAQVRAVAKGLIASGVGPGDRVGLLSRTRYEWTVLDFAIWCAGAVTVPVYETSSAEQVQWILADSGAVAVVVEQPAHEQTVETVRPQLPRLERVWQIDGGALEALAAAGRDVDDAEIDSRRADLGPDSPATVIYTSGTTGRPKGCELTHGNFLFDVGNAVQLLDELFLREDAATLLFLPLAHVFARIIQIGAIMARCKLGHTADIRDVGADLASFQPTFVLGVPRVFEKVFNTASQTAHSESRVKGRLFEASVTTAVAYSESLDAGGPGRTLRVRHALFDRLVYVRLRAALGGRATYAISGGAPLGPRLGHFFRGVGFRVLEGYGLTETTAAAAVNPPAAIRIGTVGQPLPGTSLGVADDGEILVRGGHVLRGYRGDAAATAAAFTADGWFRTGDLGELDDDGYLRITGRKKEILVTAGGKNVAPAALEDRIRAHPLVSQCLVVGDGRPYIAALVTIDPEAFPAWKQQHGKPGDASVSDLAEDEDLRAAVQAAVDQGNRAVSRAEGIKRFRILGVDFTEAGGQLTPKLSLRRAVVTQEFAEDIAALYEPVPAVPK